MKLLLIIPFHILIFSAFANVQDVSLIESQHIKFISSVDTSNIATKAPMFLTDDVLAEIELDDEYSVDLLLYHLHLKNIYSTYDEVRKSKDDGCLTINGFLPDASRVTLLYHYKEIHSTPKINEMYIYYLGEEDEFLDSAQCPDEFSEAFLGM